MKTTTYTLNTAARQRLADWVYNNHKLHDAANLTHEVSRGKANHAAGACGADCVLCRPCVVSNTYAAGACGGDCVLCRPVGDCALCRPVGDCALCRPCAVSNTYAAQWAVEDANDRADNFKGCGYVELAPWETYSGHTERIDFELTDFDITEEDDGEE